MRKAFCLLVAIVSTLALSANVASADRRPGGDFEGLVDVGGHRLFVRCMGEGSPTVVLESGLADTTEVWSKVQPSVAGVTRVCAYDRAGDGRSDPASAPRTTQDIVDDLRALLRNASIPGPYVIVGHSFGGFSAQLLAREDGGVTVAGAVLVDGTPPPFIRILDSFGVPLPTPAQNPEGVDLHASADEVLAAPPFPDLPLIVLGRTVFGPPAPPGSPGAQLAQYWNELQADQARLSPQGELVFVEGASHYIQLDRPDVVIASIQRMVEMTGDRIRPGQGCGDGNHFHQWRGDCQAASAVA